MHLNISKSYVFRKKYISILFHKIVASLTSRELFHWYGFNENVLPHINWHFGFCKIPENFPDNSVPTKLGRGRNKFNSSCYRIVNLEFSSTISTSNRIIHTKFKKFKPSIWTFFNNIFRLHLKPIF